MLMSDIVYCPTLVWQGGMGYGYTYPHPREILSALWPTVVFYDKQWETIESVLHTKETVVVAGHQLGKDYVAGFIALYSFLIHPTARIITTSVKDDHLRVLWGEIGRFIDTCKVNLNARHGGPLIVKHRELRKKVNGEICKISYLLGLVSEKGEGLAGHHAPYTLLILDECSGIDDIAYQRGDTWAKRKLAIGNPYECRNFFREAVRGGDILAPED